MSDAPERIWAWKYQGQHTEGQWRSTYEACPVMGYECIKYRRADLPATDAQAMANPKVQALVEAAFRVETSLEDHGYMQTGPMRSCLRAALAALEAEPAINWRDDPEAIVEDDEPQIGSDYA